VKTIKVFYRPFATASFDKFSSNGMAGSTAEEAAVEGLLVDGFAFDDACDALGTTHRIQMWVQDQYGEHRMTKSEVAKIPAYNG